MDKRIFKSLVADSCKEDDRPQWLRDMVNHSSWVYYRLFVQLARYMNPDLIVELGTQAGTGAFHFRHGSPTAKIVTFDIKKTFPHLIHRMNELNIEWIIEDAAKAASLVDEPVDIIFFDANHEYDNVMAEATAWMPKIKEGGVALFDDIHYNIEKREQGYLSPYNKVLAMGEETGMERAWNEIADKYGKEAFEQKNLHPITSFGVILL